MSLGWFWLTAVGPAGIYFVYSPTVEERYLTVEFSGHRPRVQAVDRDAAAVRYLEDKENSCHQAGRRQGRHAFL